MTFRLFSSCVSLKRFRKVALRSLAKIAAHRFAAYSYTKAAVAFLPGVNIVDQPICLPSMRSWKQSCHRLDMYELSSGMLVELLDPLQQLEFCRSHSVPSRLKLSEIGLLLIRWLFSIRTHLGGSFLFVNARFSREHVLDSSQLDAVTHV